tara:strand:- start:1117 stop:2583 length:1467 start_codon:yes stop_codon:yes gene_type:complete
MNKLASKIVAFLLLLTCSFVSFAQTATGSKEIHNYNDSFFTNMSGEIMLGSIVVTDFSGGKLVTKEKDVIDKELNDAGLIELDKPQYVSLQAYTEMVNFRISKGAKPTDIKFGHLFTRFYTSRKWLKKLFDFSNDLEIDRAIVNPYSISNADMVKLIRYDATKEYEEVIDRDAKKETVLNIIMADNILSEGQERVFHLDPTGHCALGPGETFCVPGKNWEPKIKGKAEFDRKMRSLGLRKLNNGEYQCVVKMNNFVVQYIRDYRQKYKGTKRYSENAAYASLRKHIRNSYSKGLYKLTDVRKDNSCTDNHFLLGKSHLDKLNRKSAENTFEKAEKLAAKYDVDLLSRPVDDIRVATDLVHRSGDKLLFNKRRAPSATKAYIQQDYLALAFEVFARSNANNLPQNDLRNVRLTAHLLDLIQKPSEKSAFIRFMRSNPGARETINNVVFKIFKQDKRTIIHAENVDAVALMEQDPRTARTIAKYRKTLKY